MTDLEKNDTQIDLWLVRHCQSMQQSSGRLIQGDINLSAFGLKQADRLASRLGLVNGFNAIYSSPLQRAKDTAIRIGDFLNQHVLLVEDLREIEFGQASSLSIEEFRQKWPDLASMWDDAFNTDFRWPGGESREEFHQRSLGAIDALVQAHYGTRIIVIAHTGNLCGYLAHLFLGDALRWREIPLELGSISRVEVCPSHKRLLFLNDVSHFHDLEDTLGY